MTYGDEQDRATLGPDISRIIAGRTGAGQGFYRLDLSSLGENWTW